ncbi:uncharacterized protein LOC142414397 isoform X3 [Mycteria americana]|uniref:uncharacterized protein LOC142414397 isoform X3 n=1 Tax=Mycteria americana TaxID=33587 RepID=UPI003F5893B5
MSPSRSSPLYLAPLTYWQDSSDGRTDFSQGAVLKAEFLQPPPAFSFCSCLLSASSGDIERWSRSDLSPSCRAVPGGVFHPDLSFNSHARSSSSPSSHTKRGRARRSSQAGKF